EQHDDARRPWTRRLPLARAALDDPDVAPAGRSRNPCARAGTLGPQDEIVRARRRRQGDVGRDPAARGAVVRGIQGAVEDGATVRLDDEADRRDIRSVARSLTAR